MLCKKTEAMENIVRHTKSIGFLLISLILCIISSFFCKSSEAALENRKDIITLDFADDENFIILNNYLSTDDILNQFKVREKLLSLSYAELNKIQKRIEKMHSMKGLKGLLKTILSRLENKGIYCLQEDIFVNNTPQLLDSPFYGNSGQDRKVTDLKPHAERLYFDNLKLEYRKNKLFKKPDGLWINLEQIKNVAKRQQKQEITEINLWSLDKLTDQTVKMWDYRLRNSNLTDYLISLRQWIKRYEENSLYPVIYQETVLMRNEYRLFCVDLLSGKELWSFKNPDRTGHEFYQTFRHLHLNSDGYEFLLEKDMIFTELAGKLMAVKLKNILAPQLLWEHNLGEYTVCTRPIHNKNILIVGLINARGEFWISGFNCESGTLEWSTYIGTCSFLSPPCEISGIKDNRVFLGTNNGVLICLNSKDGRIIWLKKYSPKKYSLFDFWKDYHFLDEDLIKYDTQFIEIEDSRLLYYKPRESDYVYVLDQKDGKAIEEILVDPDRYYILRAWNGKGVFFEKTNGNAENAEVKIVELKSGKEIYNMIIKSGALKGVIYLNKNEILFKVDNVVHFLRMDKDKVSYANLGVPSAGWLLNSKDRFLLVGKGETLFCLDGFDKKYTYLRNDLHRQEYLEQRERIKNSFIKDIQLDTESKQVLELRKQIMHDITVSDLPLDEIFPIIVNNLKRLKQPSRSNFFTKLRDLYSDEVVTYKDIEMKFVNFLYENNLVDFKYSNDAERTIKNNASIGEWQNYQVRGDRIFLLPIEVIKNSKLPDFFLLLNNDQLLCVDETGNVLWDRKVFYRSYPYVNRDIEYSTDMAKGRMYTDNIEAYLYDNILIVNDHVNIIAVNVTDGSHIWSMTNKGAIFDKEKQVPLDNLDTLYKKYGLRRSFLKNIMLYAEFVDDRIIITHGNKIYSVKPTTGYCERYRELDIEGPIGVTASKGYIYILSYFLDNLKILNKKFELLGDFCLDFINDKDAYPELVFIKNYVVLYINSYLYIIDKEDGRLRNSVNIGDLGMHYIEAYKDNLLAIAPFQKLSSYRLEKDSLKVNWEFSLGSVDQEVLWKYPEKKTKHYFIVGDHILLPFRKGGDYFITSVDLKTGEKIWEKNINGVKGFLYDLSDYSKHHGEINFIITTGGEEIFQDEVKDQAWDYAATESISVHSKLFKLDLASGNITSKEKVPAICANRMILKSNLAGTENYFIYVINGKLLKAERKNR